MTRAVVVRYRTRPDAADDNERLIKAVFEELAAVWPAESATSRSARTRPPSCTGPL